jgi:NAD(P)-dependent dehydrogenase (short-subunit alcohol dehydrogenase family)
MTHRSAALITGGAVRLGAAIAERLARGGHDVAIHFNRSSVEADALAADLALRYGVRTCTIGRDLSEKDIGTLVGQASEGLGSKLGVLVNSASLYKGDSLADLEADCFDLHMAVNVRAPLLLTQAFAEQAGLGGCIINILDQRVLRPTPHFISYSLSKDALHSATLKSAQALARLGIRVNGVAPGLTLPGVKQDRIEYDRRIAQLPLRRGGCPDEVAAAVEYFVTGAPSVTGQILAIDGGQHIAFDEIDVPEVQVAG